MRLQSCGELWPMSPCLTVLSAVPLAPLLRKKKKEKHMFRAKEADRGKFQLWHINKYKLNTAKLGAQLSKIISAHDWSDESVLQSISASYFWLTKIWSREKWQAFGILFDCSIISQNAKHSYSMSIFISTTEQIHLCSIKGGKNPQNYHYLQ